MKKKILFLFAHLHKGGMQRAVSNITQAIGGDYELHVAYFGTENPDYKYDATMHDLNIPGSLKNSLIDKVKKYIYKLKILKEFINSNSFDSVISFGESASLLSLLSEHNSKKILSVRVAIDEGLGKGLYATISKLLIKIFYKKADLIVTVSKKLEEDCKKLVGDSVALYHIPNMYPIDNIREKANEPLPEEYRFLEDEDYIINVGSLCYQKGQDLLIEAYSKLGDLKNNYKLVLVGRGPDKGKLLKLVEELDLKDKVIFVDFQSNPYNFMKNSSLFVLSSRYEGFPNVLMEAMICGKAVVAFDCPTGPNEIIKNGIDGILIDKIDEQLLSSKLENLLLDDDKIKIFQSNAIIKSNQYSFDKIANAWRNSFENY